MSRLARAVASVVEDDWPEGSDFERPEVVLSKESVMELLGTSDVVKIEESSDPTAEPMGFRHTHESVDETAVLQVWTVSRRVDGIKQDGEERLFGSFDTAAGAELGGVSGELRSVLQDRRLGFGPYDSVEVGWPLDNSDMAGKNEYRADIRVNAYEHARDL